MENLKGCRFIKFYSKSYIINQTYKKIQYFGLKKNTKKNFVQLGGGMFEKNNVFLLGNTEKIKFCIEGEENNLSKELNLLGIGNSLIELKTAEGILEFGVLINLNCIGKHLLNLTHIIKRF